MTHLSCALHQSRGLGVLPDSSLDSGPRGSAKKKEDAGHGAWRRGLPRTQGGTVAWTRGARLPQVNLDIALGSTAWKTWESK